MWCLLPLHTNRFIVWDVARHVRKNKEPPRFYSVLLSSVSLCLFVGLLYDCFVILILSQNELLLFPATSFDWIYYWNRNTVSLTHCVTLLNCFYNKTSQYPLQILRCIRNKYEIALICDVRPTLSLSYVMSYMYF